MYSHRVILDVWSVMDNETLLARVPKNESYEYTEIIMYVCIHSFKGSLRAQFANFSMNQFCKLNRTNWGVLIRVWVILAMAAIVRRDALRSAKMKLKNTDQVLLDNHRTCTNFFCLLSCNSYCAHWVILVLSWTIKKQKLYSFGKCCHITMHITYQYKLLIQYLSICEYSCST